MCSQYMQFQFAGGKLCGRMEIKYIYKNNSLNMSPLRYTSCQPLEADDPPSSKTNVNNFVYPSD